MANSPGSLNGNGKGGATGFKPKFPLGVAVKPPTMPIGIKPIGFKPIGIKPIGFKPIGIKPIGFKPIGITPIGFKPIGIKPIGFKPIGIKLPPKPIGIIGFKPIGIKPFPPKPFPIGIKLPPKYPKWPTYPKWPHYPHYPKYPHWPHFPHCTGGYGGVGYPIIEMAEPYPVQMASLPQGGVAYNLQCALPQGSQPQELAAVNVNLISTDGNNFQVSGVVSDANQQQQTIETQGRGGVDTQVSMRMSDDDELYLMASNGAGNESLQGTVRLLGRSDRNGLVCRLTQLQSPNLDSSDSQETTQE